MANKRITGLPSVSVVTSGDVIAIDGATTRKIPVENLLGGNLQAIKDLTSAANKGIQFTGAGTADVYDLTAAGKALLDDADASAQRTTLGLAIGTDVQAYNAKLADLAGISYAQGDILYYNGTNLVKLAAGSSGNFLKTLGAGANPAWASVPGGGDILAANNLSDMGDLATARGNLGMFYTVADLAAASIASPILAVNVSGYTAAGDAPPAVYVRVSTPGTVKAWHVQSSDGAYWQLTVNASNPLLFGAVGDYDSTDDSTAIQHAADYAVAFNVPLEFTRLHYATSNIYVLNPDAAFVLKGNGPFSGINFASSGINFKITGNATSLPNLSSNISYGDGQVNFASTIASSLAAGDRFFSWNATAGSWLICRNAYCQGEIFKISKIDTNTAYVYAFARDTYTVAETTLYKLHPVKVTIDNIRLMTPSAGIGCIVDFAADSTINRLYMDGGTGTSFSVRRSCDVRIIEPTITTPGYPTSNAYGISLANVQGVSVMAGSSDSTRQSLLIGGYDPTDSTTEGPALNIVNRDVRVQGMHLHNTTSDSADMHGNCEDCEYNSCTMWTGAAIGGQNNRLVNCKIYSIRDSGVTSGYCVYGTEIRGGRWDFVDCDLIFPTGDLAAQGAVHILNNYTNCQKADLKVKLRGCTFIGAGSSSGMAVQVISIIDTNLKYVDVDIQNCSFGITTLSSILYMAATDTTTAVPSHGLIVDSVSYTGSSTPYLIYPSASIAACPRREMRQSGYVDVTTPTGSAIASPAATNLKFKYSKLPTCFAGVSSQDGTAASTHGGKTVETIIYSMSASTVRPAIVTNDLTNFSTGTGARLHWSAEIRDI